MRVYVTARRSCRAFILVETQGFLNEPALALSGGSGPALRNSPDKRPILKAKGAAQDLSSVVRVAFRRFDALVVDNADALHEPINNRKSFAGALARNSNRIGVILASLERPGGGSSKQTVTLYELAAPAMLALDNSPPEQLTVSRRQP